MTGTPNSDRLHIVIAGNRNSGKSSLLNAITGQQVAIVSDIPGTTTDHVSKAMEIIGLGPCLLVDTAGLDDCGELGDKRVGNSVDALLSADIAVAVVDAVSGEIPELPDVRTTIIPVINKCDAAAPERIAGLSSAVEKRFGKAPVTVSALKHEGIRELISRIQENTPEEWSTPRLTEGVVQDGDLVMLVMPQDRQAPKGRLILPQQQAIRELLDRGCRIVCCTPDSIQGTLGAFKEAPSVIISDSQALGIVSPLKPDATRLTSFSMLLAASKGDIDYFKSSVRVIDSLTAASKVLIAEACTHVPASEDIGRIQIPRLLRSRAGEGLRIDTVSGQDFPDDLKEYDLIIHCGACMFNRSYVMARVQEAKRQEVPMTNYGITLAYFNNLL